MTCLLGQDRLGMICGQSLPSSRRSAKLKDTGIVPALPIHAHNAHCAFFVMHGSHTCIDCERSTIDEECLESRRSFLPKPHKLEYMIFGKFKMQAGGSSFKDMYFFTLQKKRRRRGRGRAVRRQRRLWGMMCRMVWRTRMTMTTATTAA